ncbi:MULTISPECIES: non-ribosomal peptide synthetase [Roseobacteraceae]|uniref:Dimodular nonribosomal peptide synthase n=1 Tax=Pseudosulfitobacter pseudonitzschiae TaxID=1402135 RepID=A0A221K495_9RHOB|nr:MULTISPECIES: non-ribosomal peptide synthetase [Roseobacteraceae]ASM73834.1 dimodular nonribosomal peptide synthase [Pseudosulfitobacter pseudonitzschiae]
MLLDNTFVISPDQTSLSANAAQNGIWFAEQLSPDGYLFNLAEYLSLQGDLDTTLFLDTLRWLANEIQAPRARLVPRTAGLQVEIAPHFEGEIPLIDFSDHADPMAAATTWMQTDLKDHKRGLWRAALIRLNARHHLWYHCAHHVLLDGHSGGLIARRCAEIYTARLRGETPPPSGLAPADVLLEAERGYSDGKRAGRDRDYWAEKLAALPDPVTLSTGGTRTGGVICASRRLSIEDSNRLRAFSAQTGISLPQVMVSAFAGYVHRMTGAQDLVLAMPVLGRLSRSERAVAMMAANAVALRFDFSREISFAELVRQGGQTMMGALRHQKYRFEQVRRDLGLTRADQQVATIAVNFEPFDYTLHFGPVPARVTNLSNGSVDDLTAFIFDRGDGQGLVLTLNANPGLYSRAEVEGHLERLHLFLRGMVTRPDDAVRAAAIYLPDEQEKIAAWSDGGPAPTGASWLDAFDSQRKEAPDRIAVHDGVQRLTYDGLDAVASRIAQALLRRGVVRGNIVALLLDRTVLLPAAILALHRIGATYLPLDPYAPEKRNALILETAAPNLVLMPADRTGTAPAGMVESLVLGADLFTDAPADWPNDAQPRTAGDLAYVIFTSGSTGQPKGVDIGHGALWALLAAMRDAIGLDAATRWLAVTTIAFDIATLEMLLPLSVGGTVEIAQRHETLDPDLLNARIETSDVTHLQATPSLWSLALEAKGSALRSLTKLVGGETLPGDLARRLVTGGPLFNVYGPTETTIWSSLARITPDTAAHPSVGRPLAGERIFVLDRFGTPAPVGTIGEIWIGGVGLAQGYHARTDLTGERFIETTLGRVYRTGDLGRWTDTGTLEHFGRIDFQIKVRGHRIETGEVEAVMRQFDTINDAVVVKPDNHDHLLGYFCSTDPVEIPSLETYLRARLPDYMVPHVFIRIPAIPQTTNGKRDLKALPPITPARGTCGRAAAEPLSPTERHLLDRVRDALNRQDVGIDDDFFQLGGTSLSAARLIAGLRRDYGSDIALATVFANPGLRRLAAEIDSACAADPLSPVLDLRKADDDAPTVFCLHPVLGIGWGYSALIQTLPQKVGICALQSPALTGPDNWPDLRSMARDYVARIQAVQPEGPYFLLGWSFGGLAAQEIAHQLETQGERIAYLCLLDAFPFQPETAACTQATRVQQTLAFLGEAPDPAIRTLDALAEKLVTRPEIEALRATLGNDRFETRIRDVVEANLDLARRHVPGRVNAPIIDICATQGKSAAIDTLLDWRGNPWGPHSRAGTRRINLDCGHDDMLGPLSVAAFSPCLRAALNRHGAAQTLMAKKSERDAQFV